MNPTDWKHRDFLAPPGSWLGCDFAGKVEKVGSGVDNVRVGDRVAAFVHGGQWEGEGSFAEYVKAQAGLVWRVPDNLSDEEAAAAGGIGPCTHVRHDPRYRILPSDLALASTRPAGTAIQALYMRLGLNLPNSPSKDREPILVWGGSTSVGLYALQLLKASGYTPISVSSEKNFDLVKKFGAAAVFDCEPSDAVPPCFSLLDAALRKTLLDERSLTSHAASTDNDPETPAKVAKAYPSLQYGLDCISEGKTTVSIVKAIAAAKGIGRVVSRKAALSLSPNSAARLLTEILPLSGHVARQQGLGDQGVRRQGQGRDDARL